jgi:hypothetical protein
MVLPIIVALMGLAVWFLAYASERNGKKAPWKWAGVALLGLAIILGYQSYSMLHDYMYRSFLRGQNKLKASHYIALLFPLFSLVGVLGMHYWPRFVKPRAAAPQPIPSSEAP